MDFKEILWTTAILSGVIPVVALVSVVIRRIIRHSDLRLPKTLFCLFAVVSIMIVIPTAIIVFNSSAALDTGIIALLFLAISASGLVGTIIGFFLCWLLVCITKHKRRRLPT